jgi:hypothetical protein
MKKVKKVIEELIETIEKKEGEVTEEIIDKEIETEIEETKEIEIGRDVLMISLELKTSISELKKNRKRYQNIK